MIPAPIRCLHPKRIMNPYTKEMMVVPCAHCESCTLTRTNAFTNWCDLESQGHKYMLFVTLTYANRFIPRAKVVPSETEFLQSDLVSTDGELLGSLVLSPDKLEQLLSKMYLFGFVPYLRKEDLQKFLKRLRYYAKKVSSDRLRYFACGEYGPVHFRPHYHLLLWFDDEALLQVAEKIILESWPFGRVDVQLASGSCSQYVAGYVNSYCTLPKVLMLRSVRPFVVHSQKLGFRILQSQCKEVYETPVDEFVKRGLVVSGNYREFNVPFSYISYYYPKCRGFYNATTSERTYAYRLYETARKIYPEIETAIELARTLALDCYYFSQSNQSFSLIDKSHVRLIQYFGQSPSCIESDEFDNFVLRIYKEFLISKHFLYDLCDHQTSYEISRKVRLIENFYSRLDYLHLTEFFENQSQFFESNMFGDDELFYDQFDQAYFPYFYSNVDAGNYECTTCYALVAADVLERYRKRIKHKYQNDLNKIFVYD